MMYNVCDKSVLQTKKSFEEEYAKRLRSSAYSSLDLHEASDAGLAFDAIWAVAIGLDNARKRIEKENETGCKNLNGTLVPLENFDYTNHKMGCVLKKGFAETRFEGITVSVANSEYQRELCINWLIYCAISREKLFIIIMEVGLII